MKVYCIEDFKNAFTKLSSNKKYSDLEDLILDYFLNNPIEIIATGDLLNGSEKVPFLKKRLPDAGGYRVYFFAFIKDGNIYLSYVHPKTGSLGGSNITSEFKKYIQKKTYECIKSKTLFEITKCPLTGCLLFS